jgi:hypothetical protein
MKQPNYNKNITVHIAQYEVKQKGHLMKGLI